MYLRRYVQLVPIIGASEYKIRLYFSVCEIFVYKRAALEKIVSRKFVLCIITLTLSLSYRVQLRDTLKCQQSVSVFFRKLINDMRQEMALKFPLIILENNE